MLEYVLEDFLEVKASLDRKKTQPLKEFLLAGLLDGRHVSPVEGFLLANHLVLLESGDPTSVKELIFLSPQDGHFRVKRL